MNILREKTLN